MVQFKGLRLVQLHRSRADGCMDQLFYRVVARDVIIVCCDHFGNKDL